MKKISLDEAIQEAIALYKESQKTGITSSHDRLFKEVNQFEEAGYPIQTLIPDQDGLNFIGENINAENFWSVYSQLIRNKLCEPDGELNKLVDKSISTSVGAVLTVIVGTLGIPIIALGIMIPIAVIIVSTGVETFCELTDE